MVSLQNRQTKQHQHKQKEFRATHMGETGRLPSGTRGFPSRLSSREAVLALHRCGAGAGGAGGGEQERAAEQQRDAGARSPSPQMPQGPGFPWEASRLSFWALEASWENRFSGKQEVWTTSFFGPIHSK